MPTTIVNMPMKPKPLKTLLNISAARDVPSMDFFRPSKPFFDSSLAFFAALPLFSYAAAA